MTSPGNLPVCPIHGKAPTVVYMCCRGAKGGARMTPAQLARNRKGARARKRAARQKARPP